MSRKKVIQKQAERDSKIANAILTGKAKLHFYERPKKQAQSNRIGGASDDGEAKALTERYLRLFRFLIPGILVMLGSVNDPRNPKKITHTLPVVILYGIIMFISHTVSRRAANRELGGSKAADLMRELIPEFISTPHADTLFRLLRDIDEGILEERYEELLKEFLKSKSFNEINPERILVACDGTQKYRRGYCFDDRALSRNADDPLKAQYYVYMMESVLILDNGIVLPLLSEPLENGESLDGNGKQDCEVNAFKRLSWRLLKLLGKGRVTIVLDALYANGPVISICKNYGWEFMISLKRDCMKSVWEECDGLKKIESENSFLAVWGLRNQEYHWFNGIEYIYGKNHKKLILNVVTLTETWVEPQSRKGKNHL